MSYEKRIFKNLSLIGNFNNERVRLGNIYRLDDGDFMLMGHVSDFDSTIDIDAITEKSNPINRDMKSGSDVKVATHGNSTQPVAKEEIEVVVGSARSGVVMLKDCVTSTIKLHVIKQKLLAVWEAQEFDKKPRRYCIVSEMLHPASGTVLITESRNTRVVLKAKGPVPVGGVPTMMEGDVSVTVQTDRINHIISPQSFQPLWKGVRFKRNGEFETIG